MWTSVHTGDLEQSPIMHAWEPGLNQVYSAIRRRDGRRFRIQMVNTEASFGEEYNNQVSFRTNTNKYEKREDGGLRFLDNIYSLQRRSFGLTLLLGTNTNTIGCHCRRSTPVCDHDAR